jgi:hypothetical protein
VMNVHAPWRADVARAATPRTGRSVIVALSPAALRQRGCPPNSDPQRPAVRTPEKKNNTVCLCAGPSRGVAPPIASPKSSLADRCRDVCFLRARRYSPAHRPARQKDLGPSTAKSCRSHPPACAPGCVRARNKYAPHITAPTPKRQ